MYHKLIERIKYYFGFSAGESQGFLLLLVLLLCYLLLPIVINFFRPKTEVQSAQQQAYIDSLQAILEARSMADSGRSNNYSFQYNTNEYERNDHFSSKKYVFQPKELFAFDPNTISPSTLARTGLPMYICERLAKARNAGFKFYKPEDFKKLYGITDEMFAALAPYIEIKQPDKWQHNATNEPTIKKNIYPTRPSLQVFDINTADTATLAKIRGIGPKLSERIVRYREQLGGFYDTKQLKEVYGIDSTLALELLKYSKVNQPILRKIPINKIENLRHFYIKSYVAKAILAYRNQHGPFKSLDDLRKVKILDENSLTKLAPYLSFE
jgi:competence protein ComEA